jgi:polyisoprenoid-binding protein YceI
METIKINTLSTWKADSSHAGLNFTVVHFGISEIYGTFSKIDAKFTSSKSDYSDAVFEFEAEVNSISTNEAQRDAHLKSPDFFDAANFTAITFKSTGIRKIDGNKYKITGDLNVHGVTKSIELDTTIVKGTNVRTQKDFVAVKIVGSVNRSAFGVGPSIPGVMVSDEVVIHGSAEFAKM